jgi:hypothetical protein
LQLRAERTERNQIIALIRTQIALKGYIEEGKEAEKVLPLKLNAFEVSNSPR